jgi:biuret amidohydrolase
MKTAFGLSVAETLVDTCKPSSCALVIYDMQVGIVPQIESGQEVISSCQSLLKAAREAGFRIFFTRHLSLPTKSAGSGQLRRAMIWQRKNEPADTVSPFEFGSRAWQIVPELEPISGEIVVDKITMSAFESTFLNLAFRDAHIESFAIAGIALEVGIEPTVRHGLDLNYIPLIVADACGSRTPALKQRSLSTLADTAEVITLNTAEFVEQVSGWKER